MYVEVLSSMCLLRKGFIGEVLENFGSLSDVNFIEIIWINEIGWEIVDMIWNF